MIPGSYSTLFDFSIAIPVIEKSYLKSFGKICYFLSVHYPCEKVCFRERHVDRRQFLSLTLYYSISMKTYFHVYFKIIRRNMRNLSKIQLRHELSFQLFWLFLVFRGLFGCGEAGYANLSPSIIADLFTEKIRTRMYMIYYLGIPVGRLGICN